MSKLAKLVGLDPMENIGNVPGSSPGGGTNKSPYEQIGKACRFKLYVKHWKRSRFKSE